MYGIEKRRMMRRCLEAGLSKSATARKVGISRRTLYTWIEKGELERAPDNLTVRYGPRPPRPSILDPYKEHIDTRLAELPDLAATGLFREIRELGYEGGYGTVKRYVRKVVNRNSPASGHSNGR